MINEGVVQIATVAKLMHQKLTEIKWIDPTDEYKGKYFTSAEFAYQMVDSPVKQTIKVDMR